MKQLFRFRNFHLLAVFFVLLLQVGCTSDSIEQSKIKESNSLPSMAKFSDGKLIDLKAQWIAIQSSVAYKDHDYASKSFALKLGGQKISLAALQSRSEFEAWVSPL